MQRNHVNANDRRVSCNTSLQIDTHIIVIPLLPGGRRDFQPLAIVESSQSIFHEHPFQELS